MGAVVQVFRIIIDTRGRGMPSFPAHLGMVWRVLSQMILTGSISVPGATTPANWRNHTTTNDSKADARMKLGSNHEHGCLRARSATTMRIWSTTREAKNTPIVVLYCRNAVIR